MKSTTERLASIDCRKCNRRRIRCDRSLPQCSKCVSRGFSCPGYEKRLKWVFGAASKGPNRQDFGPFELADQKEEHSVSRISTDVAKKALIKTQSELALAHRQSSIFVMPSCPQAQLLQSTNLPMQEQVLLDHFIRVVSNQLAWYEDGSNPWCHLILPLATKSPSLLSVILGLAASNIGSRLCDQSPIRDKYIQTMASYREKAFVLLAEDLNTLRSSFSRLAPRNELSPNAIVASILLLSYLEIHWPASGLWRTHLDAAQKVNEIVRSSISFDPTSRFISEELFAACTWPLLTSYNTEADFTSCEYTSDEYVSVDEVHSQSSIFTRFLSILRHVTRIERKYHAQVNDPEKQHHLRKIFLQVETALLQARTLAIGAVRSKTFLRPDYCDKDIEHLIEAYFYAIEIYSYRGLVEFDLNPDLLLGKRTQLLQSLLTFKNPDSFAQDQPWPLFIAGTECMDDVTSQNWVEHRMNSVMQLSCAIDRPRMLCFLKAFWAQSEKKNWIHYARKWTQDQCEFLIL